MILIHHIGARSGIERVTPLACNPQGDGRLAIVASNGGSPAHPDWYYNLRAHPRITVEVGTQTFPVLAQELDDTARAELWPKLVAQSLPSANTRARPRDRFRFSCSPARTDLRPDADMRIARAYRLPNSAAGARSAEPPRPPYISAARRAVINRASRSWSRRLWPNVPGSRPYIYALVRSG